MGSSQRMEKCKPVDNAPAQPYTLGRGLLCLLFDTAWEERT